MDRIAFILTTITILIGSVILMPNEVLMVADAIYSIPPTPAWQTIGIANNATIPNSTQSVFHAQNYTDSFYLVSDGSININLTTYP